MLMRFCLLMICLVSGFFLYGCLPGSSPSIPAPSEAVPLQVTQPTASDPLLDSACVPDDLPDEASLAAFPVLDGDEMTLGSDSSEPFDEETLADNQLLSSEDQSPPDDPGQTFALSEPVFDFPMVENEKVHYFVDYFSGRARGTFKLWLERSGRYLPMMRSIFAEEGLPRDLAYLAMVESGFNDKAYSWAHAVGPWQFIESTGRRYGLRNDWWQDERGGFLQRRAWQASPGDQEIPYQGFLDPLSRQLSADRNQKLSAKAAGGIDDCQGTGKVWFYRS
jgi:membrane-bound lytic murein transglycosylase D